MRTTRVVMASGQRVEAPPEGINVRVCATRLALNPRLAGIKHLNRLEQVLASAEWQDPDIAEGLMLAADDRLIGATAANVFLVRHGRLHTPEIRDCGVAGVMRQQVLAAAKALDLGIEITDLRLPELRVAEEIFLTNSLTGIRAVTEVRGEGAWPHGEVTRAYDVFDDDRGCPRRSSFMLDREGTVRWTVHNERSEARDLDEHLAQLRSLA